MSTLDIDLITLEILPKLPIKSLIRFKCVSKSFQTAISSRYFTKLYQSLSHNTNNLLILPKTQCLVCYDLSSFPHKLVPITATFVHNTRDSVSIIGSTNGLLCCFTRSMVNYFSVLNPLTRIVTYIHTRIKGGRGYTFGFAFDNENLDYKIMVVSDCQRRDRRWGRELIQTRKTQIYSLNTDSWNEIDTMSSPTDVIRETDCGAVIDKHLLHWVFWNASLRKYRIGCFDVCKHNWVDDVSFPSFYYNHDDHANYLGFGVINERLFLSFENLVNSCVDVWAMEKYGVQDSWVKLLRVPVSDELQGGVVPVSCFEGSDRVLIRQIRSSKLFWYDMRDGGMTKAKFEGGSDFLDRQVCMCSSSFADVPGGELFEFS